MHALCCCCRCCCPSYCCCNSIISELPCPDRLCGNNREKSGADDANRALWLLKLLLLRREGEVRVGGCNVFVGAGGGGGSGGVETEVEVVGIEIVAVGIVGNGRFGRCIVAVVVVVVVVGRVAIGESKVSTNVGDIIIGTVVGGAVVAVGVVGATTHLVLFFLVFLCLGQFTTVFSVGRVVVTVTSVVRMAALLVTVLGKVGIGVVEGKLVCCLSLLLLLLSQ